MGDFVQVGRIADVKLFGKWSFDEIEIRDISLVDYLACKGDHATYLPHTAGRYQKKRFRKASCPIVERLACCLMRKGRNAGKKLMACRIVQHTLEIIHLLTDSNPIQIVVDAIINSGPREDSTRVGGAGVVRRQAVDMSPFRRVNYALYLLATGAREASFRNLKTMAECLAEELIMLLGEVATPMLSKRRTRLRGLVRAIVKCLGICNTNDPDVKRISKDYSKDSLIPQIDFEML